MKRNNKVRKMWLALLALGMNSGALAAQCPTHDFTGFIKELSTNPKVKQAFTAAPVIKQTVVATGAKLQVVQKSLRTRDTPMLAVLSSDHAQSSGIDVTVNLPDQVVARDRKGEVLKIFTFKHGDCWTLYRVEDWSLEKVLDTQDASLKSSPGARSFKRGELFNQLGIDTQSSSAVQLYIAALDSYLDGADQGSAEAAFAAAKISLSGQAPRLENGKILDLLVNASRTIPDAGLALADFYCDEGNYEETRACVNPEKSLNALVASARSGSDLALIQLGGAYETGSIVPSDLPRAMACYKEAEKGGHEAASAGIERLRSQGTIADNTIHCL
nr:sel1 repeat family protein [Pseudomonas cichorii]